MSKCPKPGGLVRASRPAHSGGAEEGGFLGFAVLRRVVRFASSAGAVCALALASIAALAVDAVGGVLSGGGGGGAATGAAAIGRGVGVGLGAASGGDGAGRGGAGATGAE